MTLEQFREIYPGATEEMWNNRNRNIYPDATEEMRKTSNSPEFSYREDEILEEVLNYIKSTYGQHYVSQDRSGKTVQVNDILISSGHAEGFYIGSAIKYLSRFGKKNGRNRKDILKAIHFVVLLLSLTDGEEGE